MSIRDDDDRVGLTIHLCRRGGDIVVAQKLSREWIFAHRFLGSAAIGLFD
jgi:hypothetical protein